MTVKKLNDCKMCIEELFETNIQTIERWLP